MCLALAACLGTETETWLTYGRARKTLTTVLITVFDMECKVGIYKLKERSDRVHFITLKPSPFPHPSDWPEQW